MDNIIAKWVPDKGLGILSYYLYELCFLSGSTSINAFLHYATAMFMAGYFSALLHHGIINKLIVFFFPSLKNFLDHMISIDILSQLSHFVFKESGQQLDLIWLVHNFDYFLNRPCPMSIATEVNRVLFYLFYDVS